jgi:ABC-type Fe3+-hydroxamate transport system substrate-binding protein
MKFSQVIAVAACSLFTFSACSSSVAQPPAPSVAESSTSTSKGAARERTITMHATVQKVDLDERKVTLKGFDGTTETIKVGDEVRNLPQVKKGDDVIVTYYQSAAFEVLKKGDKRSVATVTEGVGRAKEGEQPGAVGASVITVVADIVKLDREGRTATLKGPEGNLFAVDVRNPDNFDKVKVGDKVEITLTEAVAVDVQPAAAK